jgi:Flp pilus assembly protein TadB
MTYVGATLAGVAVLAALAATHPRSRVDRRLAMLAPRARARAISRSLVDVRALAQSGLGWTAEQIVAVKIVSALTLATIAGAAGAIFGFGPLVAAVAACAGFVLPSVHVDRLAARERERAARALITFAEWLEALVASGRPLETAVVAIAERPLGVPLVDAALAEARRAYALGAPLLPSLRRVARDADLAALASFARELESARDLGRASVVVIREERDRLRAAERARALDAAAQVEGRLLLVLVLCYLPALMLVVVVPLFIGLLNGLFV